MDKRSRTEITIETDRVFVIRQRKRSVQMWCVKCEKSARFVTIEEAVDVVGLGSRTIYSLVEAARIHFTETTEGLLLVCLNSLSLIKWGVPAGDMSADHLPINTSIRLVTRLDDGQGSQCLSQTEIQVAEHAPEADNVRWLPQQKRAWVLTPEAFNALLVCLDADLERAAQKYENIRRKLIKFFECRGCLSSEEQADETINRVARRISEGKQIWTADPSAYFYGVARRILLEYWGAPERDLLNTECLPPRAHPSTGKRDFNDAEREQACTERLLQVLEQCIEELPAENRDLIIRYYQGEKSDKIRNRKAMAHQLGIPPNALRIRVHRIREKLERAIEDRLH
jgi:RNA polymerase sigma factor (sigma-70 family)